jgi:hypothetical protein
MMISPMERLERPAPEAAYCRLEVRNQAVVLPERSRNDD